MDATSITVAIEAVDGELAVLNRRRQLLAELLTTFAPGAPAALIVTDQPAPAAVPEAVKREIRGEPAPKVPQPTRGGRAKYDWPEVGRLLRQADERGQRRATMLMERFGVSRTTADWMVKRCREMSLIADSRPATSEPIARAPFDPQRARDEAAGPSVGPVEPLPGPRGRPPVHHAEPKPSTTAERFTADAVAAVLDGAA